MSKRITMADVAREAGVSLMTVSRVINKKGEVNATTRKQVLAIVEQLGYRPSGIARGLATHHTRTLGLVVPDIANSFFAELARGAEHAAYAQEYNVFLCNANEDQSRELAVLRSLEEQRVDGVLLCSSRLEEPVLREAVTHHAAVVLFNRTLGGDNIGSVMIDDVYGGQIATQHLLRTGHQAVGFLAGPQSSFSGRLRTQGYRQAMAQVGIHDVDAWISYCPPTVTGGREAALNLLNSQSALTALFCYNDLVAVGALQACAESGRNIPGDVAVVGFDDIPLAALVTPTLTTCHLPRYELGRQSMQLLLECIGGCNEECNTRVVRPELVIRASAP
ncbi:MAG: LacI family DNA-binding transcriptional regulator [Anaerolineae bacterium]|nr:LacI family DNA-binding transcriptional regulator [Anaerolineae bacterium]